jgi:hypothetical protein
MTNTLVYLLQNLYNAPWPKEFNAGAFVFPNEDALPINGAKDLERDAWFKDEDLVDMAAAVYYENMQMEDKVFFNQWILPLYSGAVIEIVQDFIEDAAEEAANQTKVTD